MATKKRTPELIRGTATHRRTESDYMGALLDTVSLDDWQDVVKGALAAAKSGDPQARTWLAQYLIGRPEGKAPTPLTVVVQQLSGADAVVDKLANKIFIDAKFSTSDDDVKGNIRARLVDELSSKVRT